jgi:uncharacterized membrane protein YagU involved in acid resistance
LHFYPPPSLLVDLCLQARFVNPLFSPHTYLLLHARTFPLLHACTPCTCTPEHTPVSHIFTHICTHAHIFDACTRHLYACPHSLLDVQALSAKKRRRGARVE